MEYIITQSALKVKYYKDLSGHGIMAITSAFQADDAGSIPAARSINLGECNGKNKPSY